MKPGLIISLTILMLAAAFGARMSPVQAQSPACHLAWNNAQSGTDAVRLQRLRAFVARCPNDARVPTARQRIAALVASINAAETAVRCRNLWRAAQSGTEAARLAALRRFISNCPGDPNAPTARQRIEVIERAEAARARCESSWRETLSGTPETQLEKLREFVRSCPEHGNVASANQRIRGIEAEMRRQGVNQGRVEPQPQSLSAAALTMRTALAAVPANEWQSSDPQVFMAAERRVYAGGTLADMRALADAGNARAAFLVGRALDLGLFGATRDTGQALAYYRRAAEGGDAQGQFMLGYAYSTATGAGLNYPEAKRFYEMAAAQGHAPAQTNLAIMYRDGLGVAADYPRARALLAQATAANYAPAFTALAMVHFNALGGPGDPVEAARLIREGAMRGDPIAQMQLGIGLYQGAPGIAQNQTEGLSWLRRAAAAGFQPARDYLTQRGVPVVDTSPPGLSPAAAAMRDALASVSAEEWMTPDFPSFQAIERRAYAGGTFVDMRALAESGNARAQFLVARALQVGLFGATADMAQAMEWYRRGAAGGDPLAQFQLAFAYTSGMGGLTVDHAEAARLYGLSAAQGSGPALLNLGIAYRDAIGVPMDAARALALFNQAAAKNVAPAFTAIGLLHANGIGVPVNIPEAVRWLRDGATRGDAFGQGLLGMILHQGAPGVPQDEALGLDWLRRGAAAGDQNARNYLTQRGLPLQAPAPPAADAPSVFIVYFGWESEALTPEAVGILDTVVAAYQSRPDRDTVRVLVAGHDDGASDPAAGMGVSQRRANRVRDYLTSRGIPPSAVSAEALGNSSPRVATPDGVREPQNRRVEISFSTGPRP